MIELLLIITEQALLHVPLIVGAYISISLMKVPDLSIESAFVTGAVVAANVLTTFDGSVPLGLVLGASCFGGALVGCSSSLLTRKAQLPHLLSSIITFGIFHGVNQLLSGVYITLSTRVNQLEQYILLPRHPELVLLVVIAVAVCAMAYLLFKTQFGFMLAVQGCNSEFFRHYGISHTTIFVLGIMLSNALAGLSGYLVAQSNGFVEINMGIGRALLCITALIIGKTIMRVQVPLKIMVPIVGLFGYFILQQLLLSFNFNLKYFSMVQALIVLVLLVLFYKKDTTRAIDHLGV